MAQGEVLSLSPSTARKKRKKKKKKKIRRKLCAVGCPEQGLDRTEGKAIDARRLYPLGPKHSREHQSWVPSEAQGICLPCVRKGHPTCVHRSEGQRRNLGDKQTPGVEQWRSG
jgi:hypothetical protein